MVGLNLYMKELIRFNFNSLGNTMKEYYYILLEVYMFKYGIAKKDEKTKNLVKRLRPGDIAVIKHRDIDEIAALSLIQCKPRAIINTEQSISGKYPNRGPIILDNSGIEIIELLEKGVFNKIYDNEEINIINNEIFQKEQYIGRGTKLTREIINRKTRQAMDNIEIELDSFIENTLEYAKKEKDLILGNLQLPNIETKINNKHVLVVVRGKDYKKDLLAIRSYINEIKPVLIGVDGGGDALLEFGYKPDIVIGDMDSITDKCLISSREVIVHAYCNGEAPGLERIHNLGVKYKLFPAPGTSEDIAMLLAYENKADFIVAVGTHTNMIDFLEKGRMGMASTFLVRLKVGAKLIDAKGVNKLYRERLKPIYLFNVLFASLIPILMVVIFSPLSKYMIKLLMIRIKLILN